MTTNDTNPALSGLEQAAVVNSGPTSCLVQPGYGVSPTTSLVYICPANTYSTGYTRDACASCGTGLLTAGTGSTSYSACCELRFGHPVEKPSLTNRRGKRAVLLTFRRCPAKEKPLTSDATSWVPASCSPSLVTPRP
jgi:hypothetical protein